VTNVTAMPVGYYLAVQGICLAGSYDGFGLENEVEGLVRVALARLPCNIACSPPPSPQV